MRANFFNVRDVIFLFLANSSKTLLRWHLLQEAFPDTLPSKAGYTSLLLPWDGGEFEGTLLSGGGQLHSSSLKLSFFPGWWYLGQAEAEGRKLGLLQPGESFCAL